VNGIFGSVINQAAAAPIGIKIAIPAAIDEARISIVALRYSITSSNLPVQELWVQINKLRCSSAFVIIVSFSKITSVLPTVVVDDTRA
jgi:hypothetical protein